MNEEEIFYRALTRRSSEERMAYLDQACAANPALRASVEGLLRANVGATGFLERSAPAATIDQPPSEQPGTLIGPYKLLEQIGEGGMGVVYVAEQTEPVRRRVALKIIKPGMDTKQVIARFEAERQALAMMDHPHIAKVLDAGTTDAGRPYFVMELVRGLPVTEYCDKARLSPRQRLELFIDVCHAVQHAHQKGVIHRDLKPSNVMITVHDGRPVAKVIDFGVAKAVGQQLTERTVYTAHTQLVGTPLYMSPEQADFSSQDVDTRSDVYSLGVLLYELLTGQTPFDKETLTKAGFDEMRRIIREDEPPCPSRRFSTLSAQASSTVSQHRSVDERHLGRVLCGELDWIVMKALEKDRSRRYESASSLAADIQRYLSDEPVLACPPTAMYRFQKFARTHKPALVTAGAIAVCLLLGTTVSAWQAVRATEAEAQAKQATAAEAQQRRRAEANEQKAAAERDEVKSLNEELRRTLYAAHMNLAHNAWDMGGAERVQELLEQHRPKPGETDLRGFEWHYLHRLCHADLLTLKGAGRAVAYSPDGKRLVTGGGTLKAGGTVKVWDALTGKELLSISANLPKYINGVVFSPDGKRIAGAPGTPGELKIWDAQTGQEILSLKDAVNCIAYSPDGKRIASGSARTQQVNVWDAETGRELSPFKGHDDTVMCLAFSVDGKRLASGSSDLKVWDTETGMEVFTLPGQTNWISSVVFSPDGKLLASACYDNSVTVWDAQTGRELFRIKEASQGVVFSPDGKRLATAGQQTVKVWDAQTGEEHLTFKGHRNQVDNVSFSPDGQHLASASEDGTVKVWDAQDIQKPLTLQGTNSIVASMAFSPDGKRLASGSLDPGWHEPGVAKLWDALTGKELAKLAEDGDPVNSVAFSQGGKLLVSGSGVMGSRGPGQIKLWDAMAGREVLTLKYPAAVSGVALSPDGDRIASASGRDRTVKIWDARLGQELLNCKHTDAVTCVAFSPDGKRLASGSQDNTLRLWDSQSGQELLALKGHSFFITSVTFSPDGKRLASASGDHTVKLWNSDTGQEIVTLKGHTHYVNTVTFSPDGKRLASTSEDKTAKIWDPQTGQELLSYRGPFRTAAFSPNGTHLFVGSSDGTLLTYDATPLPEKP